MRRNICLGILCACCLLLSGCEGVLYFQLFNFTGKGITVVQEGRKPIYIPANESKQFRFYGIFRHGQNGLLVQEDHRQYFYTARPSYRDAIGDRNAEIPIQYCTQVGPLGFGRRIGVSDGGELYLVANGTTDLAANQRSQPIGFPLAPQ